MSRHALLIGINDYPPKSGLAHLEYAEKDASDLAAVLSGKCGFSTRLLLGKQAARDAVEKALLEAGTGETFLFFFAGHGQYLAGQYSIHPQDSTADGWKALSFGGIARRWQHDFGYGQVLAILDACRNEMRGTRGGAGLDAGTSRDIAAATQGDRWVEVLYGCSEGEVSYEVEQLGHGLFTRGLLEVLNEHEGEVDSRVLAGAASDWMGAWCLREGQGRRQHAHRYGQESLRKRIVLLQGPGQVPRRAETPGMANRNVGQERSTPKSSPPPSSARRPPTRLRNRSTHFYTQAEAATKLGKTADEVKHLVREGRLREFMDNGPVYRVEDIDKLVIKSGSAEVRSNGRSESTGTLAGLLDSTSDAGDASLGAELLRPVDDSDLVLVAPDRLGAIIGRPPTPMTKEAYWRLPPLLFGFERFTFLIGYEVLIAAGAACSVWLGSLAIALGLLFVGIASPLLVYIVDKLAPPVPQFGPSRRLIVYPMLVAAGAAGTFWLGMLAIAIGVLLVGLALPLLIALDDEWEAGRRYRIAYVAMVASGAAVWLWLGMLAFVVSFLFVGTALGTTFLIVQPSRRLSRRGSVSFPGSHEKPPAAAPSAGAASSGVSQTNKNDATSVFDEDETAIEVGDDDELLEDMDMEEMDLK